ncbi:MAG: hypothetical protein QXU75_09650, partial [Candidatus Methanomethylicaceae archaeon]
PPWKEAGPYIRLPCKVCFLRLRMLRGREEERQGPALGKFGFGREGAPFGSHRPRRHRLQRALGGGR